MTAANGGLSFDDSWVTLDGNSTPEEQFARIAANRAARPREENETARDLRKKQLQEPRLPKSGRR